MPRVCTICTSLHRNEIDQALAMGAASRRRIAAQYGLVETSIRRHERRHLPEALVSSQAILDDQRAKSLLARVDKMVMRLEKAADQCDNGGTIADLLAVAKDLRPYHELLGKVSGEIANDKLTAFMVEIGVRDPQDAKRRVEASRLGEDMTPRQVYDEAIETLRKVVHLEPALWHSAREELDRMSRAEVLSETNGHGVLGLPEGSTG